LSFFYLFKPYFKLNICPKSKLLIKEGLRCLHYFYGTGHYLLYRGGLRRNWGGAFKKIDCGWGHFKMANRKKEGDCENRFMLTVIYNNAEMTFDRKK
jgi:hypothetical protein